ncbi:HET-domain-containing protein [Podospora aff. communis PSN243]|uniref:HET-domain-containing protein n=1 Tax=Podospora aff. communis PSN243 TaxID=3040156 RepID=A0AAV9GF08_9PEZI|nr:HET-domain-containing protein [Podospora aff. communis PSN243]
MKQTGTSKNLLGLIIMLRADGFSNALGLSCPAVGVPGAESTATWLGLKEPMSQSYTEERRIQWMAEQLSNCCGHGHTQADPEIIPERLLSLKPGLRLIDKSEYPERRPRYAALSYCWGKAEEAKSQLTTTISTLAQRRLGVDLQSASPVLQDAIQIARALSIPYLWVDSICILQDDIADWERQCVDVATIYNNAYVTLCASSSTSCLEGFLKQRGSKICMPFTSSQSQGITGSYDLDFKWAESWSPSLDFTERELWNDLSECRWANRGWTFQEARSSTRQLVFGQANLHFLCPSGAITMGDSQEEFSLAKQHFISMMGKEESPQDGYRLWSKHLHSYSRFTARSFTQPTDLLPGLSGLAANANKALQGDYVAGLWKQDLHLGLLWYASRSQLAGLSGCLSRCTSHDGTYLVPSWSPIGYGYDLSDDFRGLELWFDDFQVETERISAETVLKGSNPYGAIKDAWLSVRGTMLDLRGVGAYVSKMPFRSLLLNWVLRHGESFVGAFSLDFAHPALNIDKTTHNSDDNDGDADIPCVTKDLGPYQLLLLGSCRTIFHEHCEDGCQGPEPEKDRGAIGLILHPAPDSDKFYRVGAFFPILRGKHGDGLRLFRTMGEVRDVVII